MTSEGRVPWNLSVNADLKRQMEIHCAVSGEEISERTEMLYREFLRKQGVRIEEPVRDSKSSTKRTKKR